jgi:hypothetical protein
VAADSAQTAIGEPKRSIPPRLGRIGRSPISGRENKPLNDARGCGVTEFWRKSLRRAVPEFLLLVESHAACDVRLRTLSTSSRRSDSKCDSKCDSGNVSTARVSPMALKTSTE